MGTTTRALYAANLGQLTNIALGIWVALWLLDVTMMVVSIMAYTGAQSEDDRAIIKETYITFPPAGHHIQRTEIALASLGIVLHIVLPTYSSVRIEPLRKVFSLSEAKKGRISLLKYPVAYSLVATAAWAVCIAFQSDYVPILGTNKLPECVEFGDELSQCGMLTASWILAMIYCALHLTSLIVHLETLRRLTYPVEMDTQQLLAMHRETRSAPPKRGRSKP